MLSSDSNLERASRAAALEHAMNTDWRAAASSFTRSGLRENGGNVGPADGLVDARTPAPFTF